MWTKVFVFGCWCFGLCGSINSSPADFIGLRGHSIILPCTPNHTDVHWKKVSQNGFYGSDEQTLYNGHDVPDRLKYEVGEYDHGLTIRRLTLEDGGTYKCILRTNGNATAIKTEGILVAKLTVVDADPICNANFTSNTELREGNLLRVTCRVLYMGMAYPVTQCLSTRSMAQSSTSIPMSSNSSNGTVVVASVNIQVDIDLDGQALNCTTYFRSTSNLILETNGTTIIPSRPSNIRGYRHSWQTARLYVVYKPRNVRLDPEFESYDLGSTIRCTSDANPRPTLVVWHNTGNGQVIPGVELTIESPVFSPGTFEYRCTVTNVVGSSNSTFTIRVKGEKNGVLMTFYTIGLPVIVIILALVTTTGVLVAKNRSIRKELKKQEETMACAELRLTEDEPLHDYDEIIDDTGTLSTPETTTNPDPSNEQTDVYDNESIDSVPPKEPDFSYTGLTGPRDTPGPSAYTTLQNSGQPPSPLQPPGDDSSTSSSMSGINTEDVASAQTTPARTPNYANQPLNVGDNAEEAVAY